MIAFSVHPERLERGRLPRLQIVLENGGPGTCTNVQLSVDLPNQVRRIRGRTDGTWGVLPAGASVMLELQVEPETRGSFQVTTRSFSYRDGWGNSQRVPAQSRTVVVVDPPTAAPQRSTTGTAAGPTPVPGTEKPSVDSKRRVIFICYEHEDNVITDRQKPWIRHVLDHLKQVEQLCDVSVVSDQELRPGQQWHPRLQEYLQRTVVAVLLLGPRFMNSSYIRQHELPVLLERRERGEVTVIPLLLRPCQFREAMFEYAGSDGVKKQMRLADLQHPGGSSTPLIELGVAASERTLDDMVSRVLEILRGRP